MKVRLFRYAVARFVSQLWLVVLLQIENFGELIGWKATDSFEVVVKTDLNRLTKLINQYAQTEIDINHELKLLKIESEFLAEGDNLKVT
jgi:hypothetical protein